MCFYTVYYVCYDLIKMEQNCKICYNIRQKESLTFQLYSSTVLYWTQNKNFLSFLYALIFGKHRNFS